MQGDIGTYVQSARLKDELRSRAFRGSATGTCARVPADQSAPLPITPRGLSGGASPGRSCERSEKWRNPARAVR
jgi:hypothetical protein